MQELPLLVALSALRSQAMDQAPVADQVVLDQVEILMPLAALAAMETPRIKAAMAVLVHAPAMVAMDTRQQVVAQAATMHHGVRLVQRPHQKRLAS